MHEDDYTKVGLTGTDKVILAVAGLLLLAVLSFSCYGAFVCFKEWLL